LKRRARGRAIATAGGAICVGGGIDHKNQINDVTQCYDLHADVFPDPNANLGPLPQP